MKYLQPAIGFHLELPKASLIIAIKGYKIIKGMTPSEYGDILNDLPFSDKVTLESLSFYGVLGELSEKSKFFLEDKQLSNKELFFLSKEYSFSETYNWLHVMEWSEESYMIGEPPNDNFFVEPWRNNKDRNHLLNDSIFFVINSRIPFLKK